MYKSNDGKHTEECTQYKTIVKVGNQRIQIHFLGTYITYFVDNVRTKLYIERNLKNDDDLETPLFCFIVTHYKANANNVVIILPARNIYGKTNNIFTRISMDTLFV